MRGLRPRRATGFRAKLERHNRRRSILTNLIWRKFFSTHLLLGVVNLAVAAAFFHFSSVEMIEDRAAQQMSSVRDLAAQKLVLHLAGLKAKAHAATIQSLGGTLDPVDKSLLAVVLLRSDGTAEALRGGGSLDLEAFKEAPDFSFTATGADQAFVKIPRGKERLVWVFSGQGMDAVLAAREGLGQTGEVYLVGTDLAIRSASRLMHATLGLRVDNASSRGALSGERGTHLVHDYRGVEVLSSFAPFTYDGLAFAILSEIDRAEVLGPMRIISRRIILLSALLLALTVALALYSAKEAVREVEAMKKEINVLNLRIINAQEEERKRIALNVHDGIGQSLSALKWGLSQLRVEPGPASFAEKAELALLCEDALREVRSVSDDLMPSTIAELGCFIAIRDYLSRQERLLGLKIDYSYSPQLEGKSYVPGFEVNVYRMTQEFVQNAHKHARASKLSMAFFQNRGHMVMRFEDDGKGMDAEAPLPRSLGHRAALMGGSMKRIRETSGAAFQVEFPLKGVLK